jgi:phosphohistidine phosphatase
MKEGDMDIILWRHAEAEDGVPDAQRRLTARGEKQAQKVARWLRKRLPEGARILSSPAVRAAQTAQALDLPFEERKELGTAASAAGILAAAGWPDAGGSVVVVGHQPTLGRVAALLLSGKETDWNIKKGAAWWFSCRGGETSLRAVSGPDL